ncbi:hypothetical protein GGR54DRAFT_412880 [Hypoxylon sp. NC1633]|nr:hypothetical protein GGR54DRAFT_412880 [Hypoxylon sp. NC1633]
MPQAMEIDSGPSEPNPKPKLNTSTGTDAIDLDLDSDNDNNTSNNNDPVSNPEDPEDPDPVVMSFDVYTNPTLPDSRKLFILEHPNRQGNIRRQYDQVSEVRLKNGSGFFELDVPMTHRAGYNRDKGLRWGGALSRSVASKDGGSLGLAGGFGVGVPTRGATGGAGGSGGAGGRKRLDDLEHELSMLDWNEAVRQDKVLRARTIGGQFPVENENNCRWMVGIFKDDNVHLTPATSLIHLRPQMHWLDAQTEQERLSRPREGAGGGAAGSSGAAAGGAASKENGAAGGGAQGGAGAAKAIHMSIKSAGADNGEVMVDTMISRLRQVQTERWLKLKYEDEESNKSWAIYNDNFLYADAKSVSANEEDPVKPGSKGKGKVGTAVAQTAAGEEDDAAEKYTAQWADGEFLKAVSGMKDNQQGDAKPSDDDVQIKAEVINPTPSDFMKKAGTGKGKGRAAASSDAAASPAKRGGRPR